MFGYTRYVREGSEALTGKMQLPPVVRVRMEEAPIEPPDQAHIIQYETDNAIYDVNVTAFLRMLTPDELALMLQELKLQAMNKHLARINQWSVGQRDNIDQIKTGELHHKRYIDDSLIMDYYAQFNSVILDVTIRYGTWAELIFDYARGTLDKLCMFVFHDNTRISAVPMACFDSGTFAAILTKNQKGGGWGERVKATQMAFSPLGSVLLTPIMLGGGSTYAQQDNYYVTSTVTKSNKAAYGAGKSYVNTELPYDEMPVLNGEGQNFYTLSGSGSFDSVGFSVTFSSGGADYLQPGKPFGVESTGTYLSGFAFFAAYIFVNFSFVPHDFNGASGSDPVTAIDAPKDPGTSDYAFVPYAAASELTSELDGLTSTASDTNVYTFATICRDGALESDYTLVHGIPNVSILKGDQQTDGVKPIHSCTGGMDTLEYQTVSMTANAALVQDGAVDDDGNIDDNDYLDTLDWHYGDYSTHLDSFYGPTDDSFEQVMWPPTTFGSQQMWMKLKDGTFETPYGSFGDLQPWLHISNGWHCVQGIIGDGEPTLQWNGSDFMGTLFSATRCQTVNCLAFDMPLKILLGQ